MAVVLYIQESDDQIISGFPEYVTLSTNVPATIFYTLDGTDPDSNSDIFIDKITLPTNGLTLTLKAIAITGSMTSSILEETYYTNQDDLDRTRLIGKEGINILPVGEAIVDSRSFDEDGYAAQTTTIPFEDLDLKASKTNRQGEDISGGTTVSFINFALEQALTQETIISSPNDNNFDPKAAYIIIDGSTEDALGEQVVRIINRPHGTFDSISPMYNKKLDEYQLVTSNFVRYMINPKTGKTTFYYHDSRDNRWLKSTQTIENIPTLNLTPKDSPPSSFVFRWIEDRAMTKIF